MKNFGKPNNNRHLMLFDPVILQPASIFISIKKTSYGFLIRFGLKKKEIWNFLLVKFLQKSVEDAHGDPLVIFGRISFRFEMCLQEVRVKKVKRKVCFKKKTAVCTFISLYFQIWTFVQLLPTLSGEISNGTFSNKSALKSA